MEAKSPLTIAIIGVIGFTVLILMMLFVLDALSEKGASEHAPLADAIAQQFKFQPVACELSQGRETQVFHVRYSSRQRLDSDEARIAEMEKVGRYAADLFDEKLKKEVASLEIQRTEVAIDGSETVSSHRIKNPHGKNPYDLE